MLYRLDMTYRLDKTCLDTDHPDTTDYGRGKIVCHHGRIACHRGRIARHRDRIYHHSLLDDWSGRDGNQMGVWSRVGGVNGTTAQIPGHCAAGYLGYRRDSPPTTQTSQTNVFSGTLVGPRERCRYPLPRSDID